MPTVLTRARVQAGHVPSTCRRRASGKGRNYRHDYFTLQNPIPEWLTPMLKMIFSTDHPENRTFGLGTERKMPGAGREREGAGQTQGEVK